MADIVTTTQLLISTVTATGTSSASATSTGAPPQGGVLEGENPSKYDPKNPITLFIIQAGIIIIFCRLLHYPLSRIRQPRVIAEVIGGILLGPSVMGRIPGFSNAIFPTASMPNLNLVANLGLILFLFLVGLEVDLRYFVSNWKIALSVGTAGMALPFGLGCAIAWGLYSQFNTEADTADISFGVYALFIGVAMAITAFPVLCRILTELKLLSTPVGIIVLSAGVSNDVVGWILLALCVALVNAGSGITALYVLLTAIAFILFLSFVVRPIFLRILQRSGALRDGPSQGIIALTLIIALTSAFFTGVIGIHPIFGAFLAGLICPHEGGFAIKVTEKIEDLVSALLLPLYFALSGLSTNLGLLDTGLTWAYVIAVLLVAFTAKFIGGTLGARVHGLVWRESFTIGALMSCKGLVELIVLNIGLQAKILSSRTFTIFVVMALVTTFATTPLTAALYPPAYQRKLAAWKRGEIDWDSGRPLSRSDEDVLAASGFAAEKSAATRLSRVSVYLRLDNMAPLLALVAIFGHRPNESATRKHPSKKIEQDDEGKEASPVEVAAPLRDVEVHGVRMVELNERGSMVMKVSEVDDYTIFDPVLNAFRVLGQMFNLSVSGEVAIVPDTSFADTLVSKATEDDADLLLMPWSATGTLSDAMTLPEGAIRHPLAAADDAYPNFIARTLEAVPCAAAVFVDRGFSGSLPTRPTAQLTRSYSGFSLRSQTRNRSRNDPLSGHHIFLPFFGLGADDRAALRLVLQLAENPTVTATVVFYPPSAGFDGAVTEETVQAPKATAAAGPALASSSRATSTRAPSSSGAAADSEAAFFSALARSLPDALADRVVLESAEPSADPLAAALVRARAEFAPTERRRAADLVVLGRHVSHFHRSGEAGAGDAPSAAAGCLGAAAEAVVTSGVRASLLVVRGKVKGMM